MFENYNESELNALIANGVEENLHLEYKGAGSLCITDGCKKELSKDVSAFANSDGGTIVYGMREYQDVQRRHLPEFIDPIDRTQFTKEWLEQVLSSHIQPKIEGLRIIPVQLSTATNQVVYVVSIPKSRTAHQAKDKRYYRRYNFQSVMMEDYEIKDVISRSDSPDLDFVLYQNQTVLDNNDIYFPISLKNNSLKLAKDIKLTVRFENTGHYQIFVHNGFSDISNINLGMRLFVSNVDLKIYNGADTRIGEFRVRLTGSIRHINFVATIFGDNMSPVIAEVKIDAASGQAVIEF